MDKSEETHNKLLRQVANSAYGITSRDWADVLADSARYVYMSGARRSGKAMWLSSITSFDDNPMHMLREEYLKAIGREEDEKIGRWLRVPEFISDDLEDCEKGVPNTKLIDPNRYFDTDMIMTREEMQYCLNDVTVTEKIFKEEKIMRFESCKPTVEKVIFNEPATIVMWSDGTKTVVKCGENDIFDPEKGVAMCCMKKLLGTNKTGSNYLDKVEKYFDKYDEVCIEECKTIRDILSSIFKPTKKSKDIPPEESIEKEFEAVTGDDWKVSDNNE